MELLGTSVRSPSEHRAITDAWRASAPNDSEIFSRERIGKGRHPDMTEFLPALRTWREMCSPAEPLASNWLAALANDNAPDEPLDYYDDVWTEAPPPLSIDSEIEMRPRPEEIVRAMGDVEIAYSDAPASRYSPAVPVGGDIEVHPCATPAIIGGTPCSPLARMGALRFGNGQTEERALVRGEDDSVKMGRCRVPRGALTHCGVFPVRDRHAAWRGSADGKIDPRSASPSVSIEDRIDAERLVGRLRQQMSAEDVAALDAALEAKNFSDIGELFGFTGKSAQRAGKSMLRDAATRLTAFLQAA